MKREWITDYAVRLKGESMALVYCVMCLADGDKTPATFLVSMENHEVGSETMKRQGWEPVPLETPDHPGAKKLEALASLLRDPELSDVVATLFIQNGTEATQ